MSSIPLFFLVLLPQQCVQNPSRTLLEIKNACKLWRNNKYMTTLVWGFPGRYQKGHSWGCSAEANLINFHDNLLFSCLFVFFPPPLFAIFWWCYNMFNAAQLQLHTCLYTSLGCAHMFDATQRRAWNSMCRLHEATCRISATESGGWPEKICHWHFFVTL